MFWINWKILFICTFFDSNIGLPELDIPAYRRRMDAIQTEQVTVLILDIHQRLIMTKANIIESLKIGIYIFFLMKNFENILLNEYFKFTNPHIVLTISSHLSKYCKHIMMSIARASQIIKTSIFNATSLQLSHEFYCKKTA